MYVTNGIAFMETLYLKFWIDIVLLFLDLLYCSQTLVTGSPVDVEILDTTRDQVGLFKNIIQSVILNFSDIG